MKALIQSILFAFQVNHEYAIAKRQARKAGINTDTDDEWLASNEGY